MQCYSNSEIVIVDGYSTDSTLDIARKYTDLIWFCKGTLGEARQIGVEKSTGDILALFDDDTIIPHKNWLKNAVKRFEDDTNISTVWPLVVAPPRSSLFARCYSNFSHNIKMNRLKTGTGLVGGTNALFRKMCINEVGGFDKGLSWGEDFYIARKLKEKGYKVVVLEDPLFHETMATVREFLKKQVVGSQTFLRTGFELVNLKLRDLLYEHIVLGSKWMFNGLFRKKDTSWTMYPLLVIIRLMGYALVSIGKSVFKMHARKTIMNVHQVVDTFIRLGTFWSLTEM